MRMIYGACVAEPVHHRLRIKIPCGTCRLSIVGGGGTGGPPFGYVRESSFVFLHAREESVCDPPLSRSLVLRNPKLLHRRPDNFTTPVIERRRIIDRRQEAGDINEMIRNYGESRMRILDEWIHMTLNATFTRRSRT